MESEGTPSAKVLYLTFFEAVNRNGIYTSQVRSVLEHIAQCSQHEIHHLAILPRFVLGRSWPFLEPQNDRESLEQLRELYAKLGITADWIIVPIAPLKRWMSHQPLLVLIALLCYALPVLCCKIRRGKYAVLHCRSYVACALALLARMSFPSTKVIFDPRGFYPEEGVVKKSWTAQSVSCRVWRRLEQWLVRRSDTVIALSPPFAKRIHAMAPSVPCETIYAGADLAAFQKARSVTRDQMRNALGLDGKRVFVYCGSLGSWHDPALLGAVYRAARRHSQASMLLILTGTAAEPVVKALHGVGLDSSAYRILSVPQSQVPAYLSVGDFGIVPLREIADEAMAIVAETMIGTKVAEYLAAGVPVIVNSQIKAMTDLVRGRHIGLFFSPDRLDRLGTDVLHYVSNYPERQALCQRAAEEYFSTARVAQLYSCLYSTLAAVRRRAMAVAR